MLCRRTPFLCKVQCLLFGEGKHYLLSPPRITTWVIMILLSALLSPHESPVYSSQAVVVVLVILVKVVVVEVDLVVAYLVVVAHT